MGSYHIRFPGLFSLSVAALLISGCAGLGKGEPQPPREIAAPDAVAAPPLSGEDTAESSVEIIPLPQQEQAEAPAAPPAQSQPLPEQEAVAEPEPMALPEDPNTYLVRVAEKEPGHPDYHQGHPMGFVVNGQQGRTLIFERGQTYRFDVKTDVKHDFYISTSPLGWGAAVFTDDVAGNFTYRGEVVVTPDADTPDTLYYQCRNHKQMGGKIMVVDRGTDIAALQKKIEAERAAAAKAAKAKQTVDETEVKQKIAYAEMLIKIKGAKLDPAQVKAASDQVAMAKEALDGGAGPEALTAAQEAVALLNQASQGVLSDAAVAELKKTYGELLESVHSFEKSHAASFERAKKNRQKTTDYDRKEVARLLAEAEDLAGKQDYSEANTRLRKAERLITAAINEMLHEQTLVYDKNFETPEEEYEYELSRFDSYLELIPVAIEVKNPSQGAIKLMETYANKGKDLREQAKGRAGDGDYENAILMLQAATSHVRRGLRLAGVSM